MLSDIADAVSCAVGQWTFLREGDPGALPWIVVALYAVAALVSIGASLRFPATRSFWIIASVVMTLLALNKELDLHILLSKTMKCLGAARGWDDGVRRALQQRVVIVAGGVAVTGVVLIAALLRAHLRRIALPAFGIVASALFVALRAASFNQLDGAAHAALSDPVLRAVLEMAGPAIVFIAGLRARGAPRNI